MSRPLIVVLDDYEDSLRRTADWKPVESRADVKVHTERLRGEALIEAVRDADAIVVVRDRTPFKADLLAKLPKLKLFVFTGARNTQLDTEALKARASSRTWRWCAREDGATPGRCLPCSPGSAWASSASAASARAWARSARHSAWRW